MKNGLNLGLLIILCLFNSCKKGVPDAELSDPEALSSEDAQILDQKKEVDNLDLNSIVLPNEMNVHDFLAEVDPGFLSNWLSNPGGLFSEKKIRNISHNSYSILGPQDARNLLIAQLMVISRGLVNRGNFQFPSEGSKAPAQDGLAYSWGGKDHTLRRSPKNSGSFCTEMIYGLDCSGFIYQVFKYAGVSIEAGPANHQRNPSVLLKAIQASIPEFKKIKVEDLGNLNVVDFEAGDIIYWLRNGVAQHIGIVLKKVDGSLAVFQSNGVPGSNEEDCAKNLSTNRGPRILELNDPFWFGTLKEYGVTRISAELSGSWELFLRCQGEYSDAIALNLNFETSDNNTFEVDGNGIDYDGGYLLCSGAFNYNSETNELQGTLLITRPDNPNYYRNDSFQVKLSRDETEYFPLFLEDAYNTDGCPVEARLLNKESYASSRKKHKRLKFPAPNKSILYHLL